MSQKPDYEALKQRVDELERESLYRKQTQKKMRENEERYHTLFENSRDAIVITTREGEIVDINKAALELFGYTEEEIMGVSFREFYVHPEDPQRFQQTIEQKGSVLDYEVDLLKKDGTKISCLLSVTVRLTGDGAVLEYQGIIRDVSRRKRYEDAILRSKERYQTLVEESFNGIFVQKGNEIIFANHRLHEMLGYDEGELLGLDHWLVYHPDYQELTRERAQARMRGEAVKSQYEVKLLRKDGSWFYGDINARAIGFDGEPGIQVWIKDITERRQAKEALRDSEQRYRSVFENTGTATVIIEEDEIISMLNTEFEKLSGYSEEEVVGKKRWTEFVAKEDFEQMEAYHAKRRENGEEAPTEYEFRFVDKQGNVKDILNKVGMIPGTKKKCCFVDGRHVSQAGRRGCQTERTKIPVPGGKRSFGAFYM